MKTMIRRNWPWFFGALLLLMIGGSYRLYITLTDGFSFSSIAYDLQPLQEWEIPPLSSEEAAQIKTLLDQPYTYLGKGAQSYAFSSADNQYVLKFFKFKHLVPNPIVHVVPGWPKPLADWKQSYFDHKHYRLQTLFDGHHLAYTYDKDHSAIVFIHLNSTSGLDLKTEIVDKLGRKNRLDLNPIAFVIQKKGATARSLLKESLKNGDVDSAWVGIKSILDMLVLEYHKGLYDRDHGVLHNTGFVDDVPFHLDVGKLTLDENAKTLTFQMDDMHKVVHRILPWIHRNYPEYEVELKAKIENHLKLSLDPHFQIL